eukprot:scaffold148148_cov107-Cyclotella_meneghiniana.AAC.2
MVVLAIEVTNVTELLLRRWPPSKFGHYRGYRDASNEMDIGNGGGCGDTPNEMDNGVGGQEESQARRRA